MSRLQWMSLSNEDKDKEITITLQTILNIEKTIKEQARHNENIADREIKQKYHFEEKLMMLIEWNIQDQRQYS